VSPVNTHLRNRALPLAGRLVRRPTGEVEDTILILQPDHLGDILLAQPAVRMIRESHPTSRLIAVVGPWSREIAELSWPVDEVISVSFPGFTREAKASPVEPYQRLRTEARRLAGYRARTAFVLRPDAWWAAWLSSLVAPDVVTSADERCAPFATRTAVVNSDDHAACRAIQIATAGTSPPNINPSTMPLTLVPPPSATVEARRLLDECDVGDRFVVIHPGSGAVVKEWPVHRWASLS
jgi:ADP-heptose:LPS heptosyltransferase